MDDLNSFAFLSEMEFGLSEPIKLDPVNVHLLPGEKFQQFDLLNYGCRFGLTNYRIIILSDIVGSDKIEDKGRKYNIISIPLGLIYHIEYYGMVCVNILTKVGFRLSITFPDIELCEETLRKIKKARIRDIYFGVEFFRALKEDSPSHFLINGTFCSNDWKDELHTIENEFHRLQFPPELWRISHVNKDFKVCTSYPQYHIILKDFSDISVKDMAKFRSKNRFITAVYRSIDTGAVLLRSGQPLTGVSGWRNSSDEQYFSLITQLNKSDNKSLKMMVFDARSYTSAQLNKVKGGGIESETYYPGASVEFLNIPNMHTVRSSLESLSNAMSGDNVNFYDMVEKSTWLLLIRDLIKSANSICNIMYTRGKSVLVHCSDGWDRTPQLTSLAMILMDPFYRTIKGFKTLVQREWIYFGHRFNERCALWKFEANREYSPIFVQWLDCVYQLQHQFVDHFEFNEKFLIKMALHVYSGLFGTFINLPEDDTVETCSLWNFLCCRDIRAFINPLYTSNKTFNIMKPMTHMVEMKVWTGLYRYSLDPNCHNIYSSEIINRDLPPEFNNLIMSNSIIDEAELEDDYEGENNESLETFHRKPIQMDNVDDKSEIFNCNDSLDSIKKVEISYFRHYTVKCNLETIEEMLSDCDSQDIAIDGLYIQKDTFFTVCETNRQIRHLLKRKVKYFKNAYHNCLKTMTLKTQKDMINDFDDICENSSADDDNDTVFSDASNLEDIVLWVPDHAVTHCTNCNDAFGMFTRKHHCRSCGKIFCKKCSSHQSPVIKQKITWPEKVCDKCFYELNSGNTCEQYNGGIINYIGDFFHSPFRNSSSITEVHN